MISNVEIDKTKNFPFKAELAERSPIIIQNCSNPSSRKNLDVRPYDRMTVQGATFNMRGQLYRGHAVVQWSVHWAPSRTTRVLDLAGARRCALETCGKNKMRAPLLGLAKPIYYSNQSSQVLRPSHREFNVLATR